MSAAFSHVIILNHLPSLCPPYSGPCTQPKRWPSQTGSVLPCQKNHWLARTWTQSTHQIEIVLDHVALEGLQGQRPVAHSHDKGVMDKPVPRVLDVRPREEILEEVPARYSSVERTKTYGGKRTARKAGYTSSESDSAAHGRLPDPAPSGCPPGCTDTPISQHPARPCPLPTPKQSPLQKKGSVRVLPIRV